jgi:hypothetical protein
MVGPEAFCRWNVSCYNPENRTAVSTLKLIPHLPTQKLQINTIVERNIRKHKLCKIFRRKIQRQFSLNIKPLTREYLISIYL